MTDNDSLASYVAVEMESDLLVLLSDIDGIYSGPPSDPSSRLIRHCHPGMFSSITIGKKSSTGRGGMKAKVMSVLLDPPLPAFHGRESSKCILLLSLTTLLSLSLSPPLLPLLHYSPLPPPPLLSPLLPFSPLPSPPLSSSPPLPSLPLPSPPLPSPTCSLRLFSMHVRGAVLL